MRIGCLMVTENRAPIAGIGLASAVSQDLLPEMEQVILVQINGSSKGYLDVLQRFMSHTVYNKTKLRFDVLDLPSGIESVPARTDEGCRTLFEHYACDVVALFDDDDFAPPSRLRETYELRLEGATYIGYTSGWFANLRTFRAEHFDKPAPGLWGGSLAFTRAAWEHRRFTGLPAPGYDGAFVAVMLQAAQHKKGILTEGEPIAFSHGRNVCTWLMTPGIDATSLIDNLPPLVSHEVKAAQKFLVEHRVFPPQPPEVK